MTMRGKSERGEKDGGSEKTRIGEKPCLSKATYRAPMHVPPPSAPMAAYGILALITGTRSNAHTSAGGRDHIGKREGSTRRKPHATCDVMGADGGQRGSACAMR